MYPGAVRLLEIGAGQGAVGARLAERTDYVGVEMDQRSVAVARNRIEARGGKVIEGEFERMALDGTFDIVCAFEVLEHIADDGQALASWRAVLRPGGRLILSVPAHPDRFGPSDVVAGHYRRYEHAQLAGLLESSGFERPEVRSYGFPLGYILEVVRNRLAARRDEPAGSYRERTEASGRWLQPSDRSSIVMWLLALPFRWLQRPFERTRLGTGIVATAVRPVHGR